MGWHMLPPGEHGASFLPPLKILLHFFVVPLSLQQRRGLDMLVELNLGLCDTLESSVFSYTHINHMIVII